MKAKNRFLVLAASFMIAAPALAYGPSPITISQQNYHCQIATESGAVLLPTISRILLESRRTPGVRSLESRLNLGDGTGLETGNGNIDHLLAPIFGRAGYDQSSLSVELENQTGDTTLFMAPLKAAVYQTKSAWTADSQDDLQITAAIAPTSATALDLKVEFVLGGQVVPLTGSCIAQ